MISQNNSGGFTIMIGKLFMFTNPTNKLFNFNLIRDDNGTMICLGYINFGFEA